MLNVLCTDRILNIEIYLIVAEQKTVLKSAKNGSKIAIKKPVVYYVPFRNRLIIVFAKWMTFPSHFESCILSTYTERNIG